MGSKDNFVGRCIAPTRTTRKSGRRLKTTLRRLRKISCEQEGAEQHPNPVADDHDHFHFGEQVVLRLQGRVPVEHFVRTHNLFKISHATANEQLDTLDPKNEQYVLYRCAIRALCEEQLKTTAQLNGIYPPDLEMTAATQELFEQFYEAHGKPNNAEKDLLRRVGRVTGHVIDQWFAAKEFRLRAVTLMELKVLRLMLRTPGFFDACVARELERRRRKKSIFRH